MKVYFIQQTTAKHIVYIYLSYALDVYTYMDGSRIIRGHMMTSSNGNIFRVTGPFWGEFTSHRWIPLTKASDAELWCFLWSAPWINAWVNNPEAGNLRRHRAHYDVTITYPHSQGNRPIPEHTCSISHNAPFRTKMYTFLFWMGYSGIWKSAVHSGICELGQMGYDQSRLFEDSSEIPT